MQKVTSAAEAHAFVMAIKVEFSDINHNCRAYLVGSPGSSDQMIGLSHAGEPHGVAVGRC